MGYTEQGVVAEVSAREVTELYRVLSAKHAQRNGEYDAARRHYAGELWNSETNPRPDNRYSLTLNYLKPFIDKSVQLLVGRMWGVQVMPRGTDEDARRHAEALEGVIYGTYDYNEAPTVFWDVAFNSFVLRRGWVYYWWDPTAERVRFKSCIPDNFYPEYDGDRISRAIYVHLRSTASLKREHPELADLIYDDPGMELAHIDGQDQPRLGGEGYTTVMDYYDDQGQWARVMGDAVKTADLGYPIKEVPFIEFPCFPVGGEREPLNVLDQLVELNQYLCQLVSQKADIIRKYSNPTIIDYGSGQTPEAIRRAVSSDGSVIPAKPQSKIELLNWQGTTPAIDEQMTFVLDAMFDIAGKPRSSFGQTVTNQSGVVTNLALTPTLQSNEAHETIWGRRLVRLHERILQLSEKFAAGNELHFQGMVPKGKTLSSFGFRDTVITGADIDGWYKNRIKWPSALRVDDPVYIQNDLQQLASDPPAKSLYTSLEDRGIEDVEAEIDRIKEQLMDPRMHPDRLQASMEVAAAYGEATAPPMLGDEGGAGDPAAMNEAAEASASPHRSQLVEGAKGGY